MEPNEKELLRQAAAILGRIRSKKKAAASRENGKLGGRPSKLKPETRRKLRKGKSK